VRAYRGPVISRRILARASSKDSMSFLIADPPLHRAKRASPSASAASHLDLNVGAGDPHRVALTACPAAPEPPQS
jgi:hypothetical protein